MIVEKNAASVLKKETNTGDSLSEPLSAEARFRLAWQLFVALEYSVQVADRKVQAVFSVIGFLFAALSLQRNPFGAPAANTAMTYLLGFPLTFRNIALVALIGAFLICIAIALTSALGAIRPRVSLNVRIYFSLAISVSAIRKRILRSSLVFLMKRRRYRSADNLIR